ncbi:MAG: hypothetical protein AAF598_21160 [Bacteroidota bacterium]
MKHFFFYFFFFGIVAANGQTFTDPGAYNNAIVDEQTRITARNLDYITTSVHSKNFQLIENKRVEVIKQLQTALSYTQSLPDYEGNTKLRDKAIEVLEIYLETFKIDFNEALILKQGSEASYQAMEDYFNAQEKAEKKLDAANDTFLQAQQDFAKAFNMQIVEAEGNADNKLAVIGELNEYTRKIYLEQFRVSKINAAYVEALNTDDLERMKSKGKELQSATKASLEILETLKPFKGDAGYLNAALKLVNFYDELAQEDYPTVNEILSRKDNLTKEDVDTINKVIGKLNNGSGALIDKLNAENEALLKKHIPAPGKRT